MFRLSYCVRSNLGERVGGRVLSKVHQYATRRQHLTPNCYASATRNELLHRSHVIIILYKIRELVQHCTVRTKQPVGSETKMHGLVPGCNKIRFPFILFRKH